MNKLIKITTGFDVVLYTGVARKFEGKQYVQCQTFQGHIPKLKVDCPSDSRTVGCYYVALP